MLLAALAQFKDRLIEAVLILTALTFAFGLAFALNRFAYHNLDVPNGASTLVLVPGRALLGYPTDQMLKEHDTGVETD